MSWRRIFSFWGAGAEKGPGSNASLGVALGEVEALQNLRKAIEGLTYPSESDEPFDVVVWDGPAGKAVGDVVRERVGAGRKVRPVSVEDFFKQLEGAEEAARYRALRESLSKSLWKVLWVDSEETAAQSGDAENALDGQPATFWHTEFSKAKPGFPHHFVLDLGEEVEVAGIRYLPRGGNPGDTGRIKNCRFYVADKPFGLKPAL